MKAKKCVLIPLGAPLTERLRQLIKVWLASNIPKWANFQIQEAGQYLGFWLGPCTSKIVFEGPMNKWKSPQEPLRIRKKMSKKTPQMWLV